jgi:hypothetical protein
MKIEWITVRMRWMNPQVCPTMPIIGKALDVLFGKPVLHGAN